MRFVVTGALGHIGSKLIRMLPQRFPTPEIVLIDNLSTFRYSSLFDLPASACYQFVEVDVLHDSLDPWVSTADATIHLAARTDAEASFDDPQAVERVNFDGALRVAEACAASDTVLLFPSTTSVYGPQGSEVDEACPPSELNPQSPYAESKLRAERALAEVPNLRYVVCRLGTICGVSCGMRFHTAINKFCWQAATGQPLTVWKTAQKQRRPYLDLDDAVAAIAFLIRENRMEGDVLNVVTENRTVNDILATIRKQIPDLRVDLVNSPIMNQLSYTVLSRVLTERGFEFCGSIDRQITSTLQVLRGVNGLMKDHGIPGAMLARDI